MHVCVGHVCSVQKQLGLYRNNHFLIYLKACSIRWTLPGTANWAKPVADDIIGSRGDPAAFLFVPCVRVYLNTEASFVRRWQLIQHSTTA